MTVTQQLSNGGVVVRETVPSSDVVRVRFGDVDGLRALAIATIVAFLVARSVELPQNVAPALARLANDAGQGLALFLTLSAFSLAYPAIVAMRADGAAYLDVGRFAVKRLLRVYPAFLAVTIVAAVLHPLAVLVNFPALSHDTSSTTLAEFARNALFLTASADDDGARAVALVLRCYVVFPFLLALWTRAPRIAILVAIVAGGLDVATSIGHRWTVGAIVPLVLGIAAADARAQNHRIQRFGLPLAAIAAALAFALEPRIASLAGSVGAPDALRVDPLWSLAWFGLVAGIGASRLLERIAAFAPLRLLGAASYAISLVAMPVAAFAVRQAPASLGKPALAAAAAGCALAAGFALSGLVDRWFAADGVRRAVADRIGPLLDRALAIVRLDRVVIGSPTRPATEAASPVEEPVASDPAVEAYAPPPRPAPADLAVLSTRIGSADDLAAEIIETKRRLAERTAAYFAPDAEAAPEPIADVAPEPAGDPYAKPGFYKRAPSASRPATSPANPLAAERATVDPVAPVAPVGAGSERPAVDATPSARESAAAETHAPQAAADPAASSPAPNAPVTPQPTPRSTDLSTILPPAPPPPEPEIVADDPAAKPRTKASLLERVANHARKTGAASDPAPGVDPQSAGAPPVASASAATPAIDSEPAEPRGGPAPAEPEPRPVAPPRPPIRLRIGPDRPVSTPGDDRD